jgi:hypothetical protein
MMNFFVKSSVVAATLWLGTAYATTMPESLTSQVDQLSAMMLDQYAVEYKDERQLVTLKDAKGDDYRLLMFFSLGHYSGGNNYSRFMAVFSPSYKYLDEGTKVGSAKYRFHGVAVVGGRHQPTADTEQVHSANGQIVVPLFDDQQPSKKVTAYFVVDQYGELVRK